MPCRNTFYSHIMRVSFKIEPISFERGLSLAKVHFYNSVSFFLCLQDHGCVPGNWQF